MPRNRKQAFSMYVGETEKVTFAVDGSALDVIYDKFGEKTKFAYHGNLFKFSAEIYVSPTFYGWCAQLGKKLKIIAPQKVADGYKNYLRDIING